MYEVRTPACVALRPMGRQLRRHASDVPPLNGHRPGFSAVSDGSMTWCRTRSMRRVRTWSSSTSWSRSAGTLSTISSSGSCVPAPVRRWRRRWRVDTVQRELRDGLVAARTEDDPDALVVIAGAQLLVDRVEVEVHLGHELGLELADLRVDDDEPA